MSTEWQLVESTAAAAATEDDFFAGVVRDVVDFVGGRAAVLAAADGDRAQVLGRYPEDANAPDSFCLEGSPFEGLPVGVGIFRSAVPADLCGVPLECGIGTLLASAAEAGGRRIIIGVVADEEVVEHAPTRALVTLAMRTAARLSAVADRDNERRLRRYRLVADAIGEVVWEAQFATGKLAWSGPMGERFRYPGFDDSADMSWWISKIHPDDRARVTESLDAACAGTDTSWFSTYRFLRGDGTVAHVRDRCFFTRDADGRAIGAIGALQDITELHDLEQRVVLSDRMASIGTLAAGIAHEINNPLTCVLGNLELVLPSLEPNGEADLLEMLREAHQGAVRVAEIVRNMRIFARSEPATSMTADVDRVVESVLAMAKNELRHRARVQKRLGSPPIAAANEALLVQVVLNLLMNAAQAIPEGHAERYEVTVTTGVDEKGRVFVEVRDTGEGMTQETMRRMFDPFFTTKEVGQGMGLGLSLVHSAVTASGGEIAVTSARGEGSTFRVLLPHAVELPPSTSDVVVVPPRTRGRILIVDDEASVVRLLRRMLVADHDVFVAASGREALEVLRQEQEFDAVLCDVMMPELTGPDLHRQIAHERPSQAERFVFVTGGAFGACARAYVQSTTQPTITKPLKSNDVSSAVERVRQRGRRQSTRRDAREAGDCRTPERARHAT